MERSELESRLQECITLLERKEEAMKHYDAKLRGVFDGLCEPICQYTTFGRKQIHIYEGLPKLVEALGLDEEDSGCTINDGMEDGRMSVVIGKYEIFQLGNETEKGYVFE